MCGFVGCAFETTSARRPDLIEGLTRTLAHRGPDGHGTWRSDDGMVALGHRRLSVLDVSSAGDQPMWSACGRFITVFNGEIYNHLELRQELEAAGEAPSAGWRGHSDTETLLEAFRAWGAERTFAAMSGMFAVAIWDTAQRRLTLARDRFGEKPLYVAHVGDGVVFASELKAVTAHAAFDRSIDRASLDFYLRHGYVPSPSAIYEAASKLLPGTFAVIDESSMARLDRTGDLLAPVRRAYWRLADVVDQGRRDPFQGDERDAVDALERVLGHAVRSQELSDVPLGAFLSGGVDSSLIVALMQQHARQPVRTFTIGFDDPAYDESPYAAQVARHLGTDHTSVTMSAGEALARIPRIPTIWDEPFADVSQLPTLLVSEIARRDVTVALSGDGGDELFGGYERYGWVERMWSGWGWLPPRTRGWLATGLRSLTPERWDALIRVLPSRARRGMTGDRIHKLAGVVSTPDVHALYSLLVSPWKSSESLLAEPNPRHAHWSGYPTLTRVVETFMYRDAVDYLPDDLMVKVDRAAMSVSLETRAPFLDKGVAAFAWRLPLALKRRGRTGKWLLRELLHRHVPRELVERPKTGFMLPLGAWLKGELRPWAEALLEPAAMESAGLNTTPIARAWRAHLAGTEDHRYLLWNVLTYLAWREAWSCEASATP